MKPNMRHIALIPARGGSKGIKDKNLQKIGKYTLIDLAIKSCSEIDFFEKIIVSTDSKNIFDSYKPETNFDALPINYFAYLKKNIFFHKRDPEISRDRSSIYELLVKIIELKDLDFDFLWLIQPTSPFRKQEEFYKIREIMEKAPKFSSIVSIKDVNPNHPDRMFLQTGDFIEKLTPINADSSIPRQALPKVFIKDGGYYVFRKSLLNKNIFLGNHIIPFIRSATRNINIDTPEDLSIARFLWDSKN